MAWPQRLVLTGAFTLVAGFAAWHLFVPFIEGTFGFRPDDFWSYSSGFRRRALPGELIYRIDLLTGAAPLLFSVLLWASTLVVFAALLSEIHRTLPWPQVLLLLSSPVLLIYEVDTEILLLLPFAALGLPASLRPWGLLLAILLAMAIRELALLFYAPMLWALLLRGSPALRLMTVLTTAAAVLVLLAPVTPDYHLEREYWPERGIDGLRSTHLYGFAELGLADVVPMHLEMIRAHLVQALPGFVAFLLFCCGLLRARTGRPLPALWFLVVYLVFAVLSVDYGRYHYLFFAWALFASTEVASPWFDFREVETLGRRMAPRTVEAFDAALCWLHERAGMVLLVIFVLAPAGPWVERYELHPRFVEFALEVLERL